MDRVVHRKFRFSYAVFGTPTEQAVEHIATCDLIFRTQAEALLGEKLNRGCLSSM